MRIERREMSRLELKESFGAECIETACAFANAAGGYVVIGVDDLGCRPRTSCAPRACIAVKCKRRDFDLDEDPWRILLKIGLVESENEITRAAYLLFAKDPQEKFGQAKVHSGLVRGGFLTTYQIRDNKVEALAKIENQHQSSVVNERAYEISGGALKAALKDDNDEIVAKILAVYKEIANNTTISLSAVAEKVGLSARTVDEYVGIMKSAKVLRRKGGRKFGEGEILMIDNLGGVHV